MTHPIGIHLSYWQRDWSDDLLPLITRARQAGFDGAELPLLDPRSMDFRRLRAALDAQGMRATCGTGLGPTTDISSPDAAIRAAGMTHLRTCLEGCAALGSPALGGVTYAAWGAFPPYDQQLAYRRHCIESLREAGQIAADLGVTLCLEILNRFEGYLINTVEQGLALLAEVDRPAVKLHLDTFHMNIEEDSIGVAIRLAGPQIGHFHCSENHRKMPGRGHIPWGEVRAALHDVNYQGWLTIESFTQPGGEVGPALSIWRKLGEDLDAEAQAGVAFVRKEVSGA